MHQKLHLNHNVDPSEEKRKKKRQPPSRSRVVSTRESSSCGGETPACIIFIDRPSEEKKSTEEGFRKISDRAREREGQNSSSSSSSSPEGVRTRPCAHGQADTRAHTRRRTSTFRFSSRLASWASASWLIAQVREKYMPMERAMEYTYSGPSSKSDPLSRGEQPVVGQWHRGRRGYNTRSAMMDCSLRLAILTILVAS